MSHTTPSFVEQLMDTLAVPNHTPDRLWRFAFGFSSDHDGDLYTLALVLGANDSEAFYSGCAMMPASANALAADYQRRMMLTADDVVYTDPDEAFFTVQELESQEDIDCYTADMWHDIKLIVVDYGKPAYMAGAS